MADPSLLEVSHVFCVLKQQVVNFSFKNQKSPCFLEVLNRSENQDMQI